MYVDDQLDKSTQRKRSVCMFTQNYWTNFDKTILYSIVAYIPEKCIGYNLKVDRLSNPINKYNIIWIKMKKVCIDQWSINSFAENQECSLDPGQLFI